MPRPVPDALDNNPLGTRVIAAIAINRTVKQPDKLEFMPMMPVTVIVLRASRMNDGLDMIRARARTSLGLCTGAVNCGKQHENRSNRRNESGQCGGSF